MKLTRRGFHRNRGDELLASEEIGADGERFWGAPQWNIDTGKIEIVIRGKPAATTHSYRLEFEPKEFVSIMQFFVRALKRPSLQRAFRKKPK